MPYTLVFDEVMKKQLVKAAKNQQLKEMLTAMFDEIEQKGPDAGVLVDSHLFIYEMKSKHPPVRLYFKHHLATNEMYVFEFEMKTSPKKQKKTINKLRFKAGNL
ncbi:MAG: hypothetical protein Q7R76_06045 [Candidatus Woesearchaeota archaeon]|nr:hypothetical protein [Candidatus Woesearchaeota archaeon]